MSAIDKPRTRDLPHTYKDFIGIYETKNKPKKFTEKLDSLQHLSARRVVRSVLGL